MAKSNIRDRLNKYKGDTTPANAAASQALKTLQSTGQTTYKGKSYSSATSGNQKKTTNPTTQPTTQGTTQPTAPKTPQTTARARRQQDAQRQAFFNSPVLMQLATSPSWTDANHVVSTDERIQRAYQRLQQDDEAEGQMHSALAQDAIARMSRAPYDVRSQTRQGVQDSMDDFQDAHRYTSRANQLLEDNTALSDRRDVPFLGQEGFEDYDSLIDEAYHIKGELPDDVVERINQAKDRLKDQYDLERMISPGIDGEAKDTAQEYYDALDQIPTGRLSDRIKSGAMNVAYNLLGSPVYAGQLVHAKIDGQEGPLDSDYMAAGQRYGENVSYGMTNESAKMAADSLLSTANFGASMVAGGMNPTASLAIMGLQSGANEAYAIGQEGGSLNQQLVGGGVAAALEILTEKLPLDAIVGAWRTGGATAGRRLLTAFIKGAMPEAGEEFVNQLAGNAAHDLVMTGGANLRSGSFWQQSLEEALRAGLTGALSGGLLAGSGNLLSGGYAAGVSDANTQLATPQERQNRAMGVMTASLAGENAARAFAETYDNQSDPVETGSEFIRVYNAASEGKATPETTLPSQMVEAAIGAAEKDIQLRRESSVTGQQTQSAVPDAAIEADSSQSLRTSADFGQDASKTAQAGQDYHQGQTSQEMAENGQSTVDYQRTEDGPVGLDFDEYVNQSVEDESHPLTRDEADRLDAVARALGVGVRFVDSIKGGDANSVIEGNQVQIEKNNPNPVQFLLGHELTHRLQVVAPQEYDSFRKLLEPQLQGEADVLYDLYRQKNVAITPSGAMDEAVANYAGRLMQDGKVMDDFIRRNSQNRTLLEKLRQVMRDLVRRLTGREQTQARQAVKLLNAALDTAYQVESDARADAGARTEANADTDTDADADIDADASDTGNAWQEPWQNGQNNTAREGGTRQSTRSAKEAEVEENTLEVGIGYDEASNSVYPERFSLKTWSQSKYSKDRENAARAMADALDVSYEQALKYIDDVNGVASLIAADRARLDFEAVDGSPIMGNAEYDGGSVEFNTMCGKRRIFMGTFEEIQNRMPNTVFTADQFLRLRKIMKDLGHEVSCGLCYIEGGRAHMGEYTKHFLDLYEKTNPEYMPSMADMNTATGQARMKIEHPEVYERYEYFMNHNGRLNPGDKALFASQQKPKAYVLNMEYTDEILKRYKGKAKAVEKQNASGGLRMQSFSDFEIIHLLDMMQVVVDMSTVGLAAQAYTKVPDFAWAMGDTGIKINLSLIASGVDSNGRLTLDDVEGMPLESAMALRERYSSDVGTIAVVFTDEQLTAAMSDERIDFIIPFHRSLWNSKQYEMLGLPEGAKDYTRWQNESYIQPVHNKNGRKMRPDNFKPNTYWDFSVSGVENAKRYLELCAQGNRKPKFSNLLVNNGDGSYSLKEDGSTDGYWKLLIDFKMYDNDGVGAPMRPVMPNFNIEEANRMLQEYKGGHERFPVAQDAVDAFMKEYRQSSESQTQDAAQTQQGAEQYSVKGSENAKDLAKLQSENRRLQRRVEYWKGQTKRTKKATVVQLDINRLSKRLIKDYDSTLDAQAVAEELQKLGDLLVQDKAGALTYEGLQELTLPLARDLVNHARALVDDGNLEIYRQLRDYFRKNKISFSDKGDIPDYTDFRQRNRNRIHLSGNGIAMDVLWQELHDKFGEGYFPSDIINPADQLLHVEHLLDSLEPIYDNPYRFEIAYATETVANDILDSLIGEQVRQKPPTKADKQARKMIQREQEYRKRMAARIREQQRRRQKQVNDRRRQRAEESAARTRLLKIARRLGNKKLPEANRALLQQYIGELDTTAKSMTEGKANNLRELRDWYDDQRRNNPDFITDPSVERAIARLEKKQIKSMSQEDVAELTRILLHIENELRTQHRLIDSQQRHDIYVMGTKVISDLENTSGSRSGVLGVPGRYISTETLSPVRQIRRMTGYVDTDPLYALTQELADGQRKMFDYQMRASQMFTKWTQDSKLKSRLSGAKADEITITGTSKEGKAVKLTITPAMRMSLYLHSLNDQNLRHIAGGGITVPDIKLYRQGKLAEAYARGTTVTLTPSNVRSIAESMTPEERAFARAAYSYFNGMSKDAINETSEKLKGFYLAGVENYFPIHTDTSFTKSDFEALKFDGTIEGMGFLKERINSSAPVLLRDMDSVLNQSIENHGRYYGLAIPVRNFNKVWGVTKGSYNDDGSRNSYISSVQQAVKNKWGEDGYRYVEKMISDLSTGRGPRGAWDKVLDGIRSHYAGAVLTLNGSVAMKQAASYPTAAAIIGFRPLARAMRDFGRVDLNLIAKYTPLQWYRSQGFSTQELGDMAKRNKSLPKVLNWIQGVDLVTTRKLWKASEYYVRSHNKDLVVNSDAYYRAVADIYNQVIEETQPNYTTMQRPQLLRSDNALLQNLNMFKTQPFQNFNIVYDAMGNLSAKRRAYVASGTEDSKQAYQTAKQRAVWAGTSQLTQLAVFAGMTFVWNMLRGKRDKYKDEEEDEMTTTSTLAAIGKDMAGGAFAMVPFGADAWEFLSSRLFDDAYYGMDAVTVEAMADMLTSLNGLSDQLLEMAKSLRRGETVDWRSQSIELDRYLDDISKMLGVPYENVHNLFLAGYYQGARMVKGELLAQYYTMKFTHDPADRKKEYMNLLYKAMIKSPSSYDEMYHDMVEWDAFATSRSTTEESITSAMEARMKADQGVKSVDEMESRYMSPERQSQYDSRLADLESSRVWRQADSQQQDMVEDLLYSLVMENKDVENVREKIDEGAAYGVTESDYLLYRLALSMVDEPTEKGKYGTYTNDEVEAAIDMLGLDNDAASYLWLSQGKKDSSNPYG